MAPGKEWIALDDRLHDPAYSNGVEEFLNYAFQKIGGTVVKCPCVKCCNCQSYNRAIVRTHLLLYGIMKGYTLWYHHGEVGHEGNSDSDMDSENNFDGDDHDDEDDEIERLLQDRYPHYCNLDRNLGNMDHFNEDFREEEPNSEAANFFKLLDDFQQPLYEGSKGSKLSALVQLLHLKSIGKWSNDSFTLLLKLLKSEFLPNYSTLPDSYYEAKKTIKYLGFSYEKIDACANDCMLFWKEDSQLDECKICKASRWKYDNRSGETKLKANGKKIPVKISRYFPLKPRLQKLFMSTDTTSLMRWHLDRGGDKGSQGDLRHPDDGLAWKKHDEINPEFASEPRNVRLGLASDGFQPFNNARPSYGMWPVTLIPYNLPPWLYMKEQSFILSMLIPGPDGPGNAIYVYLQPLVDELEDLWNNGVQTFDASTRQNFNLHASLLWTINDFPAYGILSGWSTKGKLACPVCNKDTHSIRLYNGGKECFMGHRRYLDVHHKWRWDQSSFDGTVEDGKPPNPLSGEEILSQVKDLEGIVMCKDPAIKERISHKARKDNWNKKNIFF